MAGPAPDVNNPETGSSPRQARTRTGRGRKFLSKMWLGGTSNPLNSQTAKQDLTGHHETLFTDLYQEVRTAAPSAQLTYSLRSKLERVERANRRGIVSRLREGVSPLFIACKKGNVEIVEYLISVCQADLEQKGEYTVSEGPNERSLHTVTPLWCAAVAGKYSVVDVLVRYGADVNSMSDTGSTPVRSACFMTHLDIVRLLVNNKADIQKPNFNGGTCLINSVQSVELCEFLLKHGANVNAQDMQSKTALHYAIQEHRFETTKLLLKFGADPFLESRYGDDALQTACLKGAAQIFQFLIDSLPYSAERIASSYELLGSTFLDEHHDSQQALQNWRSACEVRERTMISKQIQLPKKQYRNMSEFLNLAELENLSLDLDALRIQSLIICERILGVEHKDMIYKLMYRGAAYADSLQYQHCIDLWKYALQLRISKDTLLYCDTCFTAQALMKLFLDLQDKNASGVLANPVRAEDVIDTIELLLADMPYCNSLIQITPTFKTHQTSWDKTLKILSRLFWLLSQLPRVPTLELALKKKVHRLVVGMDPRTVEGDTLLHLAVNKHNKLKKQDILDEVENQEGNLFPSYDVTKFLIECGARVNATNIQGSTPLHTAVCLENFKHEIVDLLLWKGAHVDLENKNGVRPSQLMVANQNCHISVIKYMSLKCLCAQVILANDIPFKGEIPQVLETFIEAH